MAKNYAPVEKKSLMRCTFAYADTSENYGWQIFEKNGINVKHKGYMEKEGENYIVVLCSIKKKDTELFDKLMNKLEQKMIVMGKTDYTAFCEKVFAEEEEKTTENK